MGMRGGGRMGGMGGGGYGRGGGSGAGFEMGMGDMAGMGQMGGMGMSQMGSMAGYGMGTYMLSPCSIHLGVCHNHHGSDIISRSTHCSLYACSLQETHRLSIAVA